MLTEAPLKISYFHITRTDNIKKNQKKIMLADAPLSGGNLLLRSHFRPRCSPPPTNHQQLMMILMTMMMTMQKLMMMMVMIKVSNDDGVFLQGRHICWCGSRGGLCNGMFPRGENNMRLNTWIHSHLCKKMTNTDQQYQQLHKFNPNRMMVVVMVMLMVMVVVVVMLMVEMEK